MVVSELYSASYATAKGTDLPPAPHPPEGTDLPPAPHPPDPDYANVSEKEKAVNIYEQMN